MKKVPLIILTISALILGSLKSANVIDVSWWIVMLLIAGTIYLFIDTFYLKEVKAYRESQKNQPPPVIESEHKSEFMKKLQKAMEESTKAREDLSKKKSMSKFSQKLQKELDKKNKRNK